MMVYALILIFFLILALRYVMFTKLDLSGYLALIPFLGTYRLASKYQSTKTGLFYIASKVILIVSSFLIKDVLENIYYIFILKESELYVSGGSVLLTIVLIAIYIVSLILLFLNLKKRENPISLNLLFTHLCLDLLLVYFCSLI